MEDHSSTADDLPQLRMQSRARSEVDRVLFSMESNGSRAEAQTIRGYIESVEVVGAITPELRQLSRGVLLIQREMQGVATRAREAEERLEALVVKNQAIVAEATSAFGKALEVEDKRLRVEEARITAEREAQRGQTELKRAVAEESAKTERFQSQNRRLIWLAVIGLLTAVMSASSWVGAIVERALSAGSVPAASAPADAP